MTLDLMTVDEAAAELRVSKMTMYRVIENGELPYLRIGQRNIRIRRQDFDSYVEGAVRSDDD